MPLHGASHTKFCQTVEKTQRNVDRHALPLRQVKRLMTQKIAFYESQHATPP